MPAQLLMQPDLWGQILWENHGLNSVRSQHPPVYMESWGGDMPSQAGP